MIDKLTPEQKKEKEENAKKQNKVYTRLLKNENLKYRTFSHYNQGENIEENLFCTIDLQLNKVKFFDNGKRFTRKIKPLESYSIGFIYHGLLFTCVNYK